MIDSNKVKQVNAPPIDDFNGYFEFLNNDYCTWILFETIMFPSATTAFQAARTYNQSERKRISELQDYDELTKIAMTIKNPQGWHKKKYQTMEKIIRDKFKRNKEIAKKLSATNQRQLVNTFQNGGDNQKYWGLVQNQGQNNLGKILMSIRSQINLSKDGKKWVEDQDLENDNELFPQVNIKVQKEGKIVDKLKLSDRKYFIFGSLNENDFKLDHPSISKHHASIYFSAQMETVVVDLNSTHGTTIFVDKKIIKLQPLKPFFLQHGHILTFGLSSRQYTLEINYNKVQQVISQRQQLFSTKDRFQEDPENSQALKIKLGLAKNECILAESINSSESYASVKAIFQQYGTVKSLRMCIEPNTGKFNGKILVFYSHSSQVTNVMAHEKQMPDLRLTSIDSNQALKILQSSKQNRQNERERSRKAKLNAFQ